MMAIFIIFENYYIPDVLKHFKEELEGVHLYRTANMTVSISSRIEAFDDLTRENVIKMGRLMKTVFRKDIARPQDQVPFKWEKGILPAYCTEDVPRV